MSSCYSISYKKKKNKHTYTQTTKDKNDKSYMLKCENRLIRVSDLLMGLF